MRLRVLWCYDDCSSNLRQEFKQIKVKLKSQNPTWQDLICAIPLDKSPNTCIKWWQCNPRNDIIKELMTRNGIAKLLAEDGIRSGDTVKLCLEDPRKKSLHIEIMDDDNSCLFSAIAYIMYDRDRSLANSLRLLAANIIESQPQVYSEAILGKPPVEYAKWIRRSESWGGGIELAIFAAHFSIEIASIDVSTRRMDLFGSGSHQRVYILYSGIHYDAIVSDDSTIFSPEDDEALSFAQAIAVEAFAAHRYTDTATFTLTCCDCGLSLKGNREAEAHAQQTLHQNFVEYKES